MHYSGAMSLACALVMFLPVVTKYPRKKQLRKRVILGQASGNIGSHSGDGMMEGGTINDSESLW